MSTTSAIFVESGVFLETPTVTTLGFRHATTVIDVVPGMDDLVHDVLFRLLGAEVGGAERTLLDPVNPTDAGLIEESLFGVTRPIPGNAVFRVVLPDLHPVRLSNAAWEAEFVHDVRVDLIDGILFVHLVINSDKIFGSFWIGVRATSCRGPR